MPPNADASHVSGSVDGFLAKQDERSRHREWRLFNSCLEEYWRTFTGRLAVSAPPLALQRGKRGAAWI
jgi:hypothetical protein